MAVLTRSRLKRTPLADVGNLAEAAASAPRRRAVRFSRSVHVRECGLEVGDMDLCRPTSHCPRICRYSPLPVTLTDEVLAEYTWPLGRRLQQLTAWSMEGQIKRLVACGHARHTILRQASRYWLGYGVIQSASTLQRSFTGNDPAFTWKVEDEDDFQTEEDANDTYDGERNYRVLIKEFLALQTKMHSEGNRGDVMELAKHYKKLQKKYCSKRRFRKKAESLHYDLTGHKDNNMVRPRPVRVFQDILNFTASNSSANTLLSSSSNKKILSSKKATKID